MNGTEPKIEIFKPFGEAFELTKKILFQPFDLEEMVVIGFAAFLAHLIVAVFIFTSQETGIEWIEAWSSPPGMETFGSFFGAWTCLAGRLINSRSLFRDRRGSWLVRARGRFMFIDCIVKNRGAIAEPWREYRKATVIFLFLLWLSCSSFLCWCIFLPIVPEGQFVPTF